MIWDRRATLVALCAGAIILRVGTAYLLPNIAHPDETFQYLEQAYRMTTGRGLVPWEYTVGARSWLLPGLITPVMKAGVALSTAPEVRLWGVTLFMIALATAAVGAATELGARAGGSAHGFFAGLLAASWSELVYLSPHVLADTLTAVPLIGALAVGYKVEAPRRRRMIWAGALFGLAFVLRIQLAPAIGVAMLAICGRDIKGRYLPMALGFLGPLLLMAVTDWVILGAPFRSALVYLRVNSSGIAETFGTAPPLGYILGELGIWGLAAPLILITAWFGARKLPVVALVAGIILVTFSLIGHKEYRFIYPALPLLFVLCGVGTADLVERVAINRGRSSPAVSPLAVLTAASVVWLVASAATGVSASMQRKWHQQIGWLQGFRIVNADPAACGVGIDTPDAWFLTGLVRLRPDIALYEGAPHPGAAAAYNYLFAVDATAKDIGDFHQLSCGGWAQKMCVYHRSGGCDAARGRLLAADPGPDVRAILDRLGLLR